MRKLVNRSIGPSTFSNAEPQSERDLAAFITGHSANWHGTNASLGLGASQREDSGFWDIVVGSWPAKGWTRGCAEAMSFQWTCACANRPPRGGLTSPAYVMRPQAAQYLDPLSLTRRRPSTGRAMTSASGKGLVRTIPIARAVSCCYAAMLLLGKTLRVPTRRTGHDRRYPLKRIYASRGRHSFLRCRLRR